MGESHESYPERSIWPIILAAGITLMAIGVVSSLAISGLGVVMLLFSLGGWAQENRALASQLLSENGEEEGDE
jgi:hypothetical protein